MPFIKPANSYNVNIARSTANGTELVTISEQKVIEKKSKLPPKYISIKIPTPENSDFVDNRNTDASFENVEKNDPKFDSTMSR